MRDILSMTLALALASGSVSALETSVGGGPQAAQSAVTSINSKVDTSIAALQAQITGFTHCSSIRKFYAPSDPKKDADDCVGVGDYDLNMASGANVNLASGQVKGAYSVANQYGGDFTGNTHGVVGRGANYGVVGYGTYGVLGQTVSSYGLYGLATGNGYGVYGNSAGSWGGVFTGPYGVYASATSSWAGEFVSPNYGVYGSGATYGVYSNGPLCVNGLCSRRGFGGTYTWNSDGWCYRANPETGGCSCPSGYGAYFGTGGFSHLDLYICE